MFFKKNKYIVNDALVNVGHIYNQVIVAMLVASASLIYGIQSGWVSPMQKVLQSDSSPSGRPLTDGEITWVASSMALAAMVGGFIHMHTTDMLGRKKAFLIILTSQAMSWVLLLISSNIAVILIARICVGVGSSGAFVVASMYIKETSQDNIRGILLSLCGTFQYIGILIIYIIGSYCTYYTTLCICLCISAISMISVTILAPETPPFLVKKEKLEEASKTLAALRGRDAKNKTVQSEMDYLKSQDQYYKNITSITFKEIFTTKAYRRGCIINMAVLTTVSLNGTFSIVTYAHSIIGRCGISISTELQTFTVPILMVSGSVILIICVDRVGRKPLLIGTYLLSAVGLAVLASFFLMKENGISLPSFIPVVSMATTVCSYSMGVMTVPQVIIAETFRFEVRSKVLCCIVAQAWLMLSGQVAFCNTMLKIIDIYGVFYVFAGVNIIGALIVLFFVPETRGRTVEQVEDLLLGRKVTSDSS